MGDSMNNFLKANEFYNSKNYLKALCYYEKAIEKQENEVSAYYNAGVCHIKLKNYKKAIEMINVALNLNQNAQYFFNLGYCYAMLADNQKALRYFNLAWALDNDDEDCEKAINAITTKLTKI